MKLTHFKTSDFHLSFYWDHMTGVLTWESGGIDVGWWLSKNRWKHNFIKSTPDFSLNFCVAQEQHEPFARYFHLLLSRYFQRLPLGRTVDVLWLFFSQPAVCVIEKLGNTPCTLCIPHNNPAGSNNSKHIVRWTTLSLLINCKILCDGTF